MWKQFVHILKLFQNLSVDVSEVGQFAPEFGWSRSCDAVLTLKTSKQTPTLHLKSSGGRPNNVFLGLLYIGQALLTSILDEV